MHVLKANPQQPPENTWMQRGRLSDFNLRHFFPMFNEVLIDEFCRGLLHDAYNYYDETEVIQIVPKHVDKRNVPTHVDERNGEIRTGSYTALLSLWRPEELEVHVPDESIVGADDSDDDANESNNALQHIAEYFNLNRTRFAVGIMDHGANESDDDAEDAITEPNIQDASHKAKPTYEIVD